MAKEIHIYGSIGYDWWTDSGITAKWFINELNAIKASGEKDVNVRINSPGGDVFEGIAIYNAILNSDLNINTIIDGIAYSMGAIIATIVHCHELEKVNRWILPVMLKKMRYEIR